MVSCDSVSKKEGKSRQLVNTRGYPLESTVIS
jgi:hypothetical protein